MVASSVDNLRDELAGLDDASVTERFRQLELEARRIEAALSVVVAEAKRRRLFLDDGHRSMAGWLRANANLANRQIRTRLQMAAIVDDLPVVIDTLAAGHIGIAQAERLATVAANPRCGRLLAGVDRRVVGTGRTTPLRRRQTLPGSLGDVRRPRRRPPTTRTRPRTPHGDRARARRNRPRRRVRR